MKIIFHNKYIPFNDVQIYLKVCDLVVLPYKTISHSGILHLAFSFGKPVIATRVGDFHEFVRHKENADPAAVAFDAVTAAAAATRAQRFRRS